MQEAIEDPDDEEWTHESIMQWNKKWMESVIISMPLDRLLQYPGVAKKLECYRDKIRQEGQQKGAAKFVLRQLTRRFGDLSAQVREKITVAGVETLELWSDRVLDARTLEEVLGPNPMVH